MKPLRELFRHRWVRGLTWAVVLPLPLWILLCNVLLWTGAIESLVTRTSAITRVELSHGSAWMIWPTRAHVRDATLLIDTYSYQLQLEVEHAVVDIRLASLFDHRVHFQEIEATGVRAQYRAKVDPEEADDPDLAAYSPFDGTPPQVQSTEPKPVPADEDAWGVDLDVAIADVDALWVDEFNFEPCGHVEGGMHWVDGGDFSVPPTTVALADATLWLGAHEAMRGLGVDAQVEILPYDTSETDPAKLPTFLSFAVAGAGVLVDAASFAVWWPEIDGKVSSEPGPLEVDVSAVGGVLDAGSRVHHHSSHAAVGPARVRLNGAVELVLEVGANGRPGAQVWLRKAELTGQPGGELARTSELRGQLLVPHGDMSRPWSIASAKAETEEVIADDLRRLSKALGSDDLQLRRGSARGHASATMGADGIPSGRYDLAIDDGVLVSGPVEVRADLASSGRVQRGKGGEIVADDLVLDSKGITVKSPGGTSEGTWVRLHDGSVRYHEHEVTVETRGKIEDARGAVVHLTHLDKFLDVVPDLQRQVPLQVHAKLAVRGNLVELELVDVEQLGLHVAALWRKRGPDWRLALLASGLTAFGYTKSNGEKLGTLVPLVGKPWYADRKRWVRQRGGHVGDSTN